MIRDITYTHIAVIKAFPSVQKLGIKPNSHDRRHYELLDIDMDEGFGGKICSMLPPPPLPPCNISMDWNMYTYKNGYHDSNPVEKDSE